ncbi:hypothetical protein FRC16_007730, partial [Serendipita sp. 398]
TLIYKYRVWWVLLFTVGGIMEVIGWVGRYQSSIDDTNVTPFRMQHIALMTAPVWFSGGCFVAIGVVLYRIGNGRRLPPFKVYMFGFSVASCVYTVIQIIGVGLSLRGMEEQNEDMIWKWTVTLSGGIILQIFFMCLLVLLSLGICWRKRRGISKRHQILVLGTIFCSALITVHCFFRIGELVDRDYLTLNVDEESMVLLDAVAICLCMFFFQLVHPGRTLREEDKPKAEENQTQQAIELVENVNKV